MSLKNQDGEQLYTHSMTGAMDTREGWLLSYTQEELDKRGLSSKECFEEDYKETLFETPIPDLPQNILEDFERRAQCERKAGGHVDINSRLPYVSVTMSDGGEYFFQGEEAQNLLDQVPPNISPEDYILAIAQGW